MVLDEYLSKEGKHGFVISSNASHSLSPVMHNAAFKHAGIDATYHALGVSEAELPEVVAALRDPRVLGANVTIPYKHAVIPLMDDLTAEAHMAKAVNTIINEGGKLRGHNTDSTGFLRSLKEGAGYDVEGRDVVMLGAGGSARAVALALLREGATVGVYNRTFEKAQSLERDLSRYGDIAVLRLPEAERAIMRASLLVNTTSVGHMAYGEADSPLPHGIMPREMVVDIIYRPTKTPLLEAAERQGRKIQNGVAMLVYQGADAFTAWTGKPAPIAVMFKALNEALDAEG